MSSSENLIVRNRLLVSASLAVKSGASIDSSSRIIVIFLVVTHQGGKDIRVLRVGCHPLADLPAADPARSSMSLWRTPRWTRHGLSMASSWVDLWLATPKDGSCLVSFVQQEYVWTTTTSKNVDSEHEPRWLRMMRLVNWAPVVVKELTASWWRMAMED